MDDETKTPEVDVTVDFKALLAQAPSPHEALARPHDYEKWHAKVQEALNA